MASTLVNSTNKIHYLVRLNYLPRIFGYLLIGVILTTHFSGSPNPVLWISLGFYSLCWPHVAYIIGRTAKDPRKAELLNYKIEAFIGGVWIALTSFSLWPCGAIIVAGFANNLITGGAKLLAKIMGFVIPGVLLGIWLVGFYYQPESSRITSYLSFAFILSYVSVISMQAFRNARLLVRSQKELRIANENILTKYETSQKELAERKKIEKELLSVNEDLRRFAYSVSHDLKAPLRGMSSLVHFIEEDLSDDSKAKANENMTLLKGRIIRLEKLISGILEYTRVNKEETITKVNVADYIQEILKDLAIPEHIQVKVIHDLPIIWFNELQLTVIFYNLIGNAIKYNDKDHGLLEIGYSDRGHEHEFYVKDNGPGIDEKFHTRVFEIFQKLHSRDDVEGNGIGLSIAKKTISQYGGRIWLQSSPSEGSTFFFTIPKQIEHTESDS